MANSILNLMQEAEKRTIMPVLEKFASANTFELGEDNGKVSYQEAVDKLRASEEILYGQFTHRDFEGKSVTPPSLSIGEAMGTADASIVFPRVINTILQEPKEPNLFLTNSVAENIDLPWNAPLNLEFPTVGALTAGDVAEGGEYPNVTMVFQQHMYSLRIKKIGLMVGMTQEIINQSIWPLMALHLRLMAKAIDRLVEERLFQTLTQRAHVTFDNNHASDAYHTTGKAIVGGAEAANGTFSYHDLVNLAGGVLGRGYTPTHFLAHPLSWGVFATDPILRATFYHGGQIGGGIWSREPNFDQQANFPYGISYVPYYALPYNPGQTLAAASSLSGMSAALVSDLYLIDARNSLFLVTRGGNTFDNKDDWFRDSKMVKAGRYVAVTAKDGGRGIAVAKNVRVNVRNEEAIYTIKQVS